MPFSGLFSVYLNGFKSNGFDYAREEWTTEVTFGFHN